MAFEAFDRRGGKGRRGDWIDPAVTVQSDAMFALNRAATTALGEPVAVVLLHDPEGPKIGFRASEADDPSAYRLRARGASQTTRGVSGGVFFRHFGIEVPASRRFPARFEAGVLVIDLSGPSEPVSSPRSRKRPG